MATWSGQLIKHDKQNEYLNRIHLFGTGDYRDCPSCEQAITGVHAIHCMATDVIYALPCNCRLGHWDSVPEWLNEGYTVIESSTEPTWDDIQDLREEGFDIPITLDEWNAYCEQQENAGQLRLPLED